MTRRARRAERRLIRYIDWGIARLRKERVRLIASGYSSLSDGETRKILELQAERSAAASRLQAVSASA